MGLFITYAGGDGNDVTLYSRAVPEPAAILLALLGLVLLPRSRRRSGV
jgi:MYXO-CTERM domain-containing protein